MNKAKFLKLLLVNSLYTLVISVIDDIPVDNMRGLPILINCLIRGKFVNCPEETL